MFTEIMMLFIMIKKDHSSKNIGYNNAAAIIGVIIVMIINIHR